VEAILRDENSILTVSSLVEGLYGLEDVCLSLPTIVNSDGIKHVLEVDLSETEKQALIDSGKSLQEIIKDIF